MISLCHRRWPSVPSWSFWLHSVLGSQACPATTPQSQFLYEPLFLSSDGSESPILFPSVFNNKESERTDAHHLSPTSAHCPISQVSVIPIAILLDIMQSSLFSINWFRLLLSCPLTTDRNCAAASSQATSITNDSTSAAEPQSTENRTASTFLQERPTLVSSCFSHSESSPPAPPLTVPAAQS